MRAVKEGSGDLRSLPCALLMVAGDDSEREFQWGGYREAVRAGVAMFSGPVIPLAIAVYLFVQWWR